MFKNTQAMVDFKNREIAMSNSLNQNQGRFHKFMTNLSYDM